MKRIVSETEFNQNFASNIRFLRNSFELTQQQIADILECDRSTYTYLELGKTSPKIYLAYQFSLIFNTPLEVLLTHNYMEGKSFLQTSRKIPSTNRHIKKLNAIMACMSEDELKELIKTAMKILKKK